MVKKPINKINSAIKSILLSDTGRWLIVFVLMSLRVQGDPIGYADICMTTENTAVTIPVRVNDRSTTGGVLSIGSIVEDAANGTVEIIDGNLRYTPNPEFKGIDTCSYELVEDGGSSVTVSVEVAVNAALDVAATRDAILAGVNSVYSGDYPTSLSVYGPTSAILSFYPGGASSGPMIVASTLGAGRVIAVPNGMLRMDKHAAEGDSEAFYFNGLNWLNGGTLESDTRIVTRTGDMVTWLESKGYTNVHQIQGYTAENLAGAELLLDQIATSISTVNETAVRDAIAGGMGLFVTDFGLGYNWWWNKLPYEIPSNRILRYSGVAYDNDWFKPKELKTIARPEAAFVRANIEDLLAILADVSIASETEKAVAVETFGILIKTLAPNDLLRKRIEGDAKAAYESIMPTRPNGITDSFEKILLKMESDILQSQPLTELSKHRMAETWYGAITEPADRSKKHVELGLDKARWRPLGMYAPPGEVVTLEFPPELVGQGYRLLISPHSDDNQYRSTYYRLPKIQRSFEMNSSVLEVGSALGGSLFVDFGKTTPGSGSVTVGVTGAVEQPHFVLGKHRNADWNEVLKHRPAPYAIIETPHFILHDRMDLDPYAMGKNLIDAEHLAGFWDRMVILEDWLNLSFSSGERNHAELMNRDYHISAGYAHAGYPYQVDYNWEPDPFKVDKLRAEGSWGDFHEVGHNHQNNWWTMSMETEVTVNVFSNFIMETLVTDSNEWSIDPENVWSRALVVHKAGKTYSSMSVWERLCFYLILADQFGWEAFHEFYGSYRADQKNNPDALPENDTEKLDQILIRFSNEVGRDLSSYMEDYGLSPSAEAKAAVSSLPKWNPFELYVVPDELKPDVGSTIQVHVYVPDTASGVSLTVDGTPVTLSVNSNEHYTYNLVCDQIGVISLVGSHDGGISETQTVTVEAVDLDIDDDGMEDAWEISNGLNTLWNDGAKDWDRDGFTTMDEYIAGNDPSDSSDYFKTKIESMEDGSISMSCPSIANRRYQLYRSDDLVTWTTYGAAQNSNPPKNSFAVPMDPSEGDKFFYRIEVSQ